MAALVDMGAAMSVVAAALQRLAADVGPQQAAELWQGTGLDLRSFVASVTHRLSSTVYVFGASFFFACTGIYINGLVAQPC